MIPLPDWNRLNPPRLPQSPSSGGAGRGCGDFSGCLLGCGGTLAVLVLAALTAQAFGIWAGLASLVVLVVAADRLVKAPRIVPGLLLGGLAAFAVVQVMARDYAHHPGWIGLNATLAFLLFAGAGYWDQRHTP